MFDSVQVHEITDQIVSWLANSSFRARPGVWHILMAPRHELSQLTEAEQRRLYSAMLNGYTTFGESMSCFAVTELAKYFGP